MRVFRINKQKILANSLMDAIDMFLNRNKEYRATNILVENFPEKEKVVKINNKNREKDNEDS